MNDILYYFAIITLNDGTQWPSIKVHDNYGVNRLIEGLGVNKMQNPSYVKDFINQVESNSIEQKLILYHDNLTLEIEGDKVQIFEDSTENQVCILAKGKLLEILLGWYGFLLSYENGNIPGVVHPNSR